MYTTLVHPSLCNLNWLTYPKPPIPCKGCSRGPKLGTYSDWGLSSVLVINKHLSQQRLMMKWWIYRSSRLAAVLCMYVYRRIFCLRVSKFAYKVQAYASTIQHRLILFAQPTPPPHQKKNLSLLLSLSHCLILSLSRSPTFPLILALWYIYIYTYIHIYIYIYIYI